MPPASPNKYQVTAVISLNVLVLDQDIYPSNVIDFFVFITIRKIAYAGGRFAEAGPTGPIHTYRYKQNLQYFNRSKCGVTEGLLG